MVYMPHCFQELLLDVSTSGIDQENTNKEKRKKEKPVVMSLDEFRMNVTTEGISDSGKTEKQHFVAELDGFLASQDDSTVNMKGGHADVTSQGQLFCYPCHMQMLYMLQDQFRKISCLECLISYL